MFEAKTLLYYYSAFSFLLVKGQKGMCQEIFTSGLFHESPLFPWELYCFFHTGGKFTAGVVDTCGKFTSNVVDTGGKFTAGITDTGGHNFLEIYTWARWHRRQIFHRCKRRRR